MANWVRYPLPVSPLESMRSGGAIPPSKGYLSDTCAIPYEKRQKGCNTPLCDTISKGYCAIWGGISHWAAKCRSLRTRVLLGSAEYCPRMSRKVSTLSSRTTLPEITRGFWCLVFLVIFFFVDFVGPFSLEKQAETNPPNIHDFQGNFLTKIHSGKFLP